MMSEKLPLREKIPERSCSKVYAQYRSYKKYLESDFNNRCGYCDDFDGWVGGPNTYHIDHFAPKKKFKELENDYNNLVYSCPFCNRFKSDDWPSEDQKINIRGDVGYIDPCDETYNEHLYRDEYGNIKPETPLGSYIHKKLQLYLGRHRVIWNLTRLQGLKNRLRKQIENKEIKNSEKMDKIKDNYIELCLEFDKYIEYLLGDISKYD